MVVSSSDLFAAGAELGQDGVDAVLVDGAQRLRGNLQLDPAVFAGDPEATLVQVGQEATAGLVVGMRDVVAGLHALAGDLAYAGHTHLDMVSVMHPLARDATATLLGPGTLGKTQRAAHYARRPRVGQPGGQGRRKFRAQLNGPTAQWLARSRCHPRCRISRYRL